MLPNWKTYYLLLHFESVFLWLIVIYLAIWSPWFCRQAVISDITAGSLKLWYKYVYIENPIYMLEPDSNSELHCWKVWSVGLFQCCHTAPAIFPWKQHKRNAALNHSETLFHLSQVSQAIGWDCILGCVMIGGQGWSKRWNTCLKIENRKIHRKVENRKYMLLYEERLMVILYIE